MREKRRTVLETGKFPTEAYDFLWRPESLPAVPLPLSGKAQGE